jgi:pyrroline-5-carboxylate reductase
MKDKTICFIGGGNMARSLIGGLIHDGYPAERLWVSDPNPQQLEVVRAGLGVRTSASNTETLALADVAVLAVKPQALKEVAREIAPTLAERRLLVVSVAAGVRSADLDRWLGGGTALVRVMPNTPALVQSGAAALYATADVTPEQRDQAESIMRAVGLALWVDDEDLMDVVTAVSGSGPAYFFLVMEALEQAAQELGLGADTARLLTLQTAFGAAKMAMESEETVADLRRRVTSPGGTTERALQVLQEGGIEALFRDAVKAARERSEELAHLLGED